MAVKKTQMYRRNLDGTETGLNPLTESQYVLMENGQTVQEVLSDRDSDKYTPVITNSSSTFKVGQGDNVDLSSSMKEGAYDSCVLKGKTMVNCIQEPSSKDIVLPYAFTDGQHVTINDTKENGALGVELKGQTLVNLLAQDSSTNMYTTRTQIDRGYRYTQQYNVSMGATRFQWDITNSGHNRLKINTKYCVQFTVKVKKRRNVRVLFEGGIEYTTTLAENSTTNIKCIVQSGEVLKRFFVYVYPPTDESYTGDTFDVLDFMTIEYQEGMENWDIPYFEGMASCKMPILTTIGKNLFNINGSLINGTSTQHTINGNSLTVTGYWWVRQPLNLKPNTTYTVTYGSVDSANDFKKMAIYCNGTSKHIINTKTNTMTFETPTTFDDISVIFYCGEGGGSNTATYTNIQIEESSTKTTYESYKSSILSLPEEVVLGGLGSARDTLNTVTGKYTKRTDTMTVMNYKNSLGSGLIEGAWSIVVTPPNKKWQSTMLCVSDKFSMGGGHSDRNCGFYENPANFVFFDRTVNSADEFIAKYGDFSFTYILENPIITKINLPSTLKSWNTTTHIYSEITENSLYPILSHSNPTYPVILKPSTKYSIVANSYSNSHANSAINFNLGGATASTTVGNRVTTITTPSTLSNELLTMSGRGNKLNNVMVIEGDVVGDEPYFEGICDVKSPILSNCGKNLFDYNLLDKQPYTKNGLTFAVVGDTLTIKGTATSGGYMSLFDYTLFDTWGSGVYANTDKYIELGEGTYCISTHGKITKPEVRLANVFGQGTKLIGHIHPKDQTTFTVSNNERFGLCLVFGFSNGATYDEEIKIQLEKTSSNTFTTYEPYKSNTTTFEQKDGKTIVLRSLPNGVCDTLNVETGEYVQRIGDVVLNGNEEWSYLETNNTFRTNIVADKAVQQNDTTLIYIISDKYTSKSYAVSWNEGKFISLHTNKQIVFRDENFTTSVAFKQWLSQNPVTVQYELATPIITTVDVQGFPYAYTNGHVQLSSGHNGQSLTPKVEFSLSANKTGQIQSNTKRVSAHQKQLDDFEAMMLTSMVQSAYDKAILQFDYEMQMMSLGGE